MSTTARLTPAARVAEIRAEQAHHLAQADAWGSSPQAHAHLAAFDRLQAERDRLDADARARGPSDPWRTAVHEAGHAVAARVLGYRVESVTITPTATRSGSCTLPQGVHPLDEAVIALAGRIAEEDICGATIGAGDSADLKAVSRCIGGMDTLFVEAKRKAREITLNHSRAIQALAHVLVRHHDLTGDEVSAVLSRYML
jgi:ATP-dependent Zn protease